MATLLEEFNAMKIKVAAAQAKGDVAALNRRIHIVDHEAERERKLRNPQKSTKIYIDCKTAEAYRDFQIEKEKFYAVCVDPHLAVFLMTRALHEVAVETIQAWLKEGEEESMPDWMRP